MPEGLRILVNEDSVNTFIIEFMWDDRCAFANDDEEEIKRQWCDGKDEDDDDECSVNDVNKNNRKGITSKRKRKTPSE